MLSVENQMDQLNLSSVEQQLQESPQKKTRDQRLISKIDKVKTGREEINADIMTEEEEKQQIEQQMKQMIDRLKEIEQSLSKSYKIRDEYNKAIAETEMGIGKITQSTQTLLYVLKKEGKQLIKKKEDLHLENNSPKKS
ncbi:UNKNOWN [Stylonychia lemnae]|uniref:Uncharacterized protein n=1 Tax=Stylonychia lemnae TaxID=5949 RepID=A0A078A9K7_STYLE|nr:UNKNOWN [Stylonychia lemnae]|eukprot:CDW78874.1 UNKNOWN [Stylonychia lemnae]